MPKVDYNTVEKGASVLGALHKRFRGTVEADYKGFSEEDFADLEAYQKGRASLRIQTASHAGKVVGGWLKEDRKIVEVYGLRYRVESYVGMVRVRKEAPYQQPRRGGGGRGVVSGFSAASRRRLIHLASMWNYEGQHMHFLTLTYPGVYAEDWRVWKRDLKVFKQWLERALSSLAGGLWRAELQKRGAPHYHLLIATATRICSCKAERRMQRNDKGKMVEKQVHAKDCRLRLFRARIAQKWAETVKRGYVNAGGDREAYEVHYQRNIAAGTQVETVDSRRQLMAYVSKYVAKCESREDKQAREEVEAAGESAPWGEEEAASWGRQWGRIGKIDTAPVKVEDITSGQAMKLKRVASGYLKASGQWRYARQVKRMSSFSVLGLGVRPGGQSLAEKVLQVGSAGFINGTYFHKGGSELPFVERVNLGAHGEHLRVRDGVLVETPSGRARVLSVWWCEVLSRWRVVVKRSGMRQSENWHMSEVRRLPEQVQQLGLL